MARVTIENCLLQVPNRFDLVLVASERARRIALYGDDPQVLPENDKATVISLREIEAGIDVGSLLHNHQVQAEETTQQ